MIGAPEQQKQGISSRFRSKGHLDSTMSETRKEKNNKSKKQDKRSSYAVLLFIW